MHKLSYKTLFIIFFFLLIGVVVLLRFVLPNQKVSAAWWNDSWSYRKSINIGNTGSIQTNIQVKILDNYDLSALVTAGKLQSDLDDLRFTDINGNLLSYWIEDSTNNSSDIWLILSSLPNGGATIYMYYGNSSAVSASSTSNMTIGGTMTTVGGYRIHTFKDNGILINATNTNAEVLVVAGGGAGGGQGGNDGSGGGGAGGLVYNPSYSLSLGASINVTVGKGGSGVSFQTLGNDGQNSVFESLTAIGGGGGGSEIGGARNGRPGGSGGGAGGYGTNWVGGAGTTGQGNKGGNNVMPTPPNLGGGGGGGAGAAGIDGGFGLLNHASGGNGLLYSISGVGVSYAGGGGDGGGYGGYGGLGGSGGGGKGGSSATGQAAGTSGTPNTGGGGGGGGGQNIGGAANSGSGGSGIVVVRYLSGTASTPATEELSPAPIAYWKFDEGVGTTAYDSTSNRNNGIFGTGNSAPVWQTEDQCISGKCLSFNGTSNLLVLPSVSNIKSISMWVYINSGQTGWHYLLDAREGLAGGYFAIDTIGGNWTKMYINGVSKEVIWANIPQGQWVHLYIESDTVFSDNINLMSRYSNDELLAGKIDEVKFYPYARTDAQIKQDYNAGKAHASTKKGSSVALGNNNKNGEFLSDGLIGYWKMEEGVGTTTLDSSGRGNTGTLSGASWSQGKYGIGISFPLGSYLDLGSTLLNTNIWTVNTQLKYINQSRTFEFFLGNNDVSSGKILLRHNGYVSYSYLFTYYDFPTPSTSLEGNSKNISFVSDGSKISLYIDGIFQSSITPPSTSLIIKMINNGWNDNAWTANCLIDELRVYSRALSPSEISQLYNWAPGPVGYWNFEENTGATVKDISGNNRNLNTYNSPIWTSGNINGAALDFNGSNQYARRTSDSSFDRTDGQALTVSVWIYPRRLSGQSQDIVANRSESEYNWMLYQHTNDGSIQLHGASQYKSSYIPPLNKWTHLEATVTTSGSYSLYANGLLVQGPMAYQYHADTPGELSIGNFATYEYFSGKIDEAKIYNYARTQKQIIEDMTGGAPATSSKSMVAYYKFDENNGTIVNNSVNGGIGLSGVFGTGNSAPTWTNNGKYGKALSFNGSNTYISFQGTTLDSIGSVGDFSITAWNYQPSFSSIETIISESYGNHSYGRWLVGTNENKGFASLYGGGSSPTYKQITGNKTLNTNEWNYIAAIYSRTENQIKLYVNGVYDKSTFWDGYLESYDSNSVQLGRLNKYTLDPIYFMNGIIDEAKIYNYALTADEVKLDYNQGSSTVFGTTNQTIGGTTTSLEYCIPGDTSPCSPPVAEYNFEENSGTSAKDISGNNNTGTFGTGNSAPTWTVGKKNIGSGLQFATNKYINFGATQNYPSNMTLNTWIKTNSNSPGGIVSKYGNSNYWTYRIYIDSNGKLNYNRGDYNGSWSTTTTSNIAINDNNWHFVSVSYDGSNMKIYIDGKLDNSTPENRNSNGDNAYYFCIGNDNHYCNLNTTGYGYFNGNVDQVRIYNYARTPAQVAYDYNKGAPVAWWKFDECQGNTINNSSGIGNTGTIVIGASGTQNSIGTCSVGTSAAWTNGASGKINSSLNFDGTDDYVALAPNTYNNLVTGANAISTSVWFKVTNQNISYQPIFRFCINGVTTSNQIRFSNYSGSLYALWFGGRSCTSDGYLEGGIDITPNIDKWTHFVGVQDFANDKRIYYLNGKYIATATSNYSCSTYIPGSSTYPDYIGRHTDQNLYLFGQVDDLRIYNYAVTPEQVKTIYNSGVVNFN